MTISAKTKVLVADDDPHILRLVGRYLERLGYEVLTAEDAVGALEIVRARSPDLVVLDIVFREERSSRGSPGDGITVLRKLREWGDVPVLMLSALNGADVKVMALNQGADDYLSKPFSLEELVARLEAILRRTRRTDSGQEVLNFCRVRIDPGRREVWKDDALVAFTKSEFDILHMLAQHPKRIFTRENLCRGPARRQRYRNPQTIDVHIRHIRQKLEADPARPTLILTVRGTGYRFNDTPA